jgi:soluble lytic murein transglycosylase-like protein
MLPLFISDVPIQCINEAAYEYKIPAKLIIAILNVERGKVGLAEKNKNGTYDLGPMQINTSWWPTLYDYGFTPKEVLNNPCANIRVGVWILGKSIGSGENLLNGVGNYHSHNGSYNQPYTQKVRITYSILNKLLNENRENF